MGPPDDPSLTPADESLGISEMAVILMSLGVAPANFKVAEGFERGLVVDCATGWNMSNEKQMKEVVQRVRFEEPVLLIGCPDVPCFQHLD